MAKKTSGTHPMMRAYEIGDQSSDLTLHQVERPIPVPGPGQLLMKVHCSGLNARDLWLMRLKNRPTHIPCSDNVGEVAGMGPDVTGFTVGDRITVSHYAAWIAGDWDAAYNSFDLGNTVDGFLAEYALVPAAATVKISNRLPDHQACTVSTAGLTAWRALAVEARPMPSETVLTLGTGGVSVFCLQVAKWFGARVIITSSSDEKLERMKALGADITVNYKTSPQWAKEVVEKNGGQGVDVVMNNVGYPEIENCFMACGDNARLVHIGATFRQVSFGPLQNFFTRGCSIKGIANGSRRMLADFLTAADVNQLQPVVERVFPFDQAVDAVRFMEGRDRVGKVAIQVAEHST
jgi:NADPH:quinone reductase-like Zn-dependent oxidoreductase